MTTRQHVELQQSQRQSTTTQVESRRTLSNDTHDLQQFMVSRIKSESAFWSDNEPQLLTLHMSHNAAVVLPRCSTHSFYSHSFDPQLTDVT